MRKNFLNTLAVSALLAACCCDQAPEAVMDVAGQQGACIVPGSAADFEVNVGSKIYFEFDKFSVTPEARAQLCKIVSWLNKYHQGKPIKIVGHCDPRGDDKYNDALGAQRAEAMKKELVASGISANLITVYSLGKHDQIVKDGMSEDALFALNRFAVGIILEGSDSSQSPTGTSNQ